MVVTYYVGLKLNSFSFTFSSKLNKISNKRLRNGNRKYQGRHELDNSQVNTDASGMTLMQMNDDCLVEIFKYLDFADLSIVSTVCKRLQELSFRTFKSVWKKKRFALHNCTTKYKLDSLRLLSQFGNVLQKVDIRFGGNRNEEFLNNIIDKCSNLTEVRFFHRSPQKPDKFLNKKNIFRLNEKFPNLKVLEFSSDAENIVDSECIEQTFSNLEHLGIFFDAFSYENLRNFINLNPQVKRLPLKHGESIHITRDLIEFIDRKLPHLEELDILIEKDYTTNDTQQLFLTNLKRLHIEDHSNEGLTFLSGLSSENVEDMRVGLFHWNDTLTDRICKFKEVKRLHLLCACDVIDGDSLIKLSESLPKLSKIFLTASSTLSLNIKDVAQFVKKSKQLTEFFLFVCSWNLNEIKENIDLTQWKVTLGKKKKLRIRKFRK